MALLAAVSVALVGCGDDATGGSDAANTGSATTGAEVAERTRPTAGPALLPPSDSELLAGLSLDRAVGPDDIDAEVVAQIEQYPNGEIALYADPAAEDPFAGPWALAVVVQGSETSGLGGEFDPHGTDVRWIDVPVEQQSQELRSAGLLVGGLDDATAADLAENTEVAGGLDGPGDDRPHKVEILPDALAAAPGGLQRITSATVSGGEIGADAPGPGTAPSVTWSRRSGSEWTSLSVTSFRADPGWELLLRAVNGGAAVGPNLLPVGGEGAVGQSTGVATIGDTTVLVQTQGSAPPIRDVLDSLAPADAEAWRALLAAFPIEPPPTYLTDADVVLTGRAGDGAYTYALQVNSFDTPFGPSTLCSDELMVAYPDGRFDGGDLSGGQPCGPTGTIGLLALVNGATLIHGQLAPDAAALRLTLDGGEVLEPELTGDVRRAFVVVLEGNRRLLQVESFAADGRLLASFPDGQPELGFPEGANASTGTVLQGR